MVVNGIDHIVAFVPTANDNTPGSSTLTVPLKDGATNVIEFFAYDDGWGELSSSRFDRIEHMLMAVEAPNIDRIMVPIE